MKLIKKSIIGGFLIGIATYLSVILSSYADSVLASKLVFALAFPIGLALVYVTGSTLVTGYTLRSLHLLTQEDDSRLRFYGVVSLVIVLIFNLAGSLIASELVSSAGVLPAADLLGSLAIKISLSPEQLVARGIICNLCVAGSFLLREKGIHILLCLLPIPVFLLLSGEHIVADFSYLILGMQSGGLSIRDAIILSGWVLIGNLLGGLIIFVVSGLGKRAEI